MATVIDEIVIRLGWYDDRKQEPMEKQRRNATDALKKMRDKAVRQAEEIEGGTADVAETFAKITSEAVLFFAALKAFKAAEKLIVKANKANSALGRFATNVGLAPQTVAAVGYATERIGGSAQDAQASIDAMARALFGLNTEGKRLPDEIYRLSSLSGVAIDPRHGLQKFLEDISAAAAQLAKTDPATTHFLLKGAGISDATANAMIANGRRITDVGIALAPTNDAIKAAQNLNASFAKAQEAIRSIGSAVAEQLDEPMAKMLDELLSMIAANKDIETSIIVALVKRIGNNLAAFAAAVKDFYDLLSPIMNAPMKDSVAAEALRQFERGPPKEQGSGEATAIPWAKWFSDTEDYFKRRAADPFGLTPTFGGFGDNALTIQGQQISRGNPLPVEIVRDSTTFGSDPNSLLGGPIGSGTPLPQGWQGGHGAPDSLRARGTPGGGGDGPPVVPQPDDTVQSLAKKYQDRYPHLSSPECVALARAAAGIKEGVWDWRRGVSAESSKLLPGTPVATFMDRSGNPSEYYDAHQGVGAPGNDTTHAAVFLGYAKDGSGFWVEEQYRESGGPHMRFVPWHGKNREGSGVNYFGINDASGRPAGTNNPLNKAQPLPPLHDRPPIPSGGARLSMLAGPQAVASRSTTRNIDRLAVKGATAQQVADNLVMALRAELTT